MKVGILGSGDVGKALARGFASRNHEVMISSREPERLQEFIAEQKVARRRFGFRRDRRVAIPGADVHRVGALWHPQRLLGSRVQDVNEVELIARRHARAPAAPRSGRRSDITGTRVNIIRGFARLIKCVSIGVI